MYRLKQHKGQITIFVILGIVLLVGAAIVFLVLRGGATNNADQLQRSVQTVDKEFRPVQQYVETCLYEIGLDGLQELGAHGGYIDPVGAQSSKSFLIKPSQPTDSDGLLIDIQDAGTFVPYWFYSRSPLDSLELQPTLGFPSIEEITRNHQEYIDRNLFSCLGDFDVISQTGSTIDILDEEPTTSVVYTDSNVVIKTEFLLDVELEDGSSKEIQSYITTIPIPFKEYYDLAYALTLYEANEQYLENLVLTIIGQFGYPSFDALPPFSAYKSSFEPVTWSQTDVNRKLKDLLLSYVSAFTVYGTQTYNSLDFSSLTDEEYLFFQKFIIPPYFNVDTTLDVTHSYLNQPIFSKVYPTQGELISPQFKNPGEGYNLYSQVEPEQHYEFFYHVSYPVLVSITDNNISGGDSFTFMFGLESNIRANRDWTDYQEGKGPLTWDPNWIETSLADKPATLLSDDVVQTQQVNAQARELFQDESQFLSNISLRTQDAHTLEPITKANVRVGIASFGATNLGLTQLTPDGYESIFEGKAPHIQNGYVHVQKQGYIDEVKPLSTNTTQVTNLGVFSMWKLVDKNISVDIFDLSSNSKREKNTHETIIIMLDRIDPNNPNPFSRVVVFDNQTSTQQIQLAPGRYTVYATYVDQEGVVIPAKCKQTAPFPQNLLIEKEQRFTPQEPIEIKPAMWGGIDFNEGFPWLFPPDQAYANNSLSFTVLRFQDPVCFEDLNMFSQLAQYSNQYRTQLTPTVIPIE